MNPLPPYEVQYQKILDAYMADEIKPYHMRFCFCGTLAYKESRVGPLWSTEQYSSDELNRMEFALLNALRQGTYPNSGLHSRVEQGTNPISRSKEDHPYYETALFNGMCAALDVLKSIHEARGEAVDGAFLLPKRQLLTH